MAMKNQPILNMQMLDRAIEYEIKTSPTLHPQSTEPDIIEHSYKEGPTTKEN